MDEEDWKVVKKWAEDVGNGDGASGRCGRLSRELLRRHELDELHAAAEEVADSRIGPEKALIFNSPEHRYHVAKAALAKKVDPWGQLEADLRERFGPTGLSWWTEAGLGTFLVPLLEIVKKHCVPKEPTP
jgi:hypothetical protein